MMEKENKTNNVMVFCVALLITFLTPWQVLAAISFNPITWGDGVDTLSWEQRDTVATSVSAPATGGEGDNKGYLSMVFEPTVPFPEEDAMVTSFADWTGNFIDEQVGSLSFDFMGYPSSLLQSVYFESTAGGGSTWISDSFESLAHTWESESVSFISDSDWNLATGGGSFASALTEVSEIGVMVRLPGDDVGPFSFGLDNWDYDLGSFAVPEPGTIIMSLTALLGMFGACRRQIFGGLRSLRSSGDTVV